MGGFDIATVSGDTILRVNLPVRNLLFRLMNESEAPNWRASARDLCMDCMFSRQVPKDALLGTYRHIASFLDEYPEWGTVGDFYWVGGGNDREVALSTVGKLLESVEKSKEESLEVVDQLMICFHTRFLHADKTGSCGLCREDLGDSVDGWVLRVSPSGPDSIPSEVWEKLKPKYYDLCDECADPFMGGWRDSLVAVDELFPEVRKWREEKQHAI